MKIFRILHGNRASLPTLKPSQMAHAQDTDQVFIGTTRGVNLELLNAENGVKLITGTYSGDNTFGSSDPIELYVDTKPTMLIITPTDNTDYEALMVDLTHDGPRSIIVKSGEYLKFATIHVSVETLEGGYKIKWYSTENSGYQYNLSGTDYSYIIIC